MTMMNNTLLEAHPIGDYRLHLRYADGHEADVDMSDVVARGIFRFLQDEDRFAKVQIAHKGAALLWRDDDGDDIDFCVDALRMKADEQAVAIMAAE